jgi:dUTP pyrophosphatase
MSEKLEDVFADTLGVDTSLSLAFPCKKLHPDAKLPTKAEGDIGWDLYCIEDDGFCHHYDKLHGSGYCYVLEPGESHLFHTGIATAIPKDYAALLWDRGSMGAVKEIHRFAGVIDSSYRGEWLVRLRNFDDHPHRIFPSDKIVQFIVQKEIRVTPCWVNELDDTERGEGRFGSTGQ